MAMFFCPFIFLPITLSFNDQFQPGSGALCFARCKRTFVFAAAANMWPETKTGTLDGVPVSDSDLRISSGSFSQVADDAFEVVVAAEVDYDLAGIIFLLLDVNLCSQHVSQRLLK